MASRGDVLHLKRGLGFGAPARLERFVVVQDDRFLSLLDTVLVVPLDVATALYARSALVVPVSAGEAGTRLPQVAIPFHLGAVRLDRFEAGVAGALSRVTLARLARVLKILQGLK